MRSSRHRSPTSAWGCPADLDRTCSGPLFPGTGQHPPRNPVPVRFRPPLPRQRQGWTAQYGSHQMCTVVVSLLNGFQLVSQNVTAVLVYPTGVAEIALFELPKLGPPIALN